MPLIYIDVSNRWTDDQSQRLLDAVHAAVLAAFEVPERDRYQVLRRHNAGELVIQDTGLGFTRTETVVVIHVVSRARTDEQKQLLYRHLTKEIERACGVSPEDVMVSITENGPADWSFGAGRAQFLTGEL